MIKSELIAALASITIREYEGRTAWNPKTGKLVTVVPKKRPFFKTGRELKERILNSAAVFEVE